MEHQILLVGARPETLEPMKAVIATVLQEHPTITTPSRLMAYLDNHAIDLVMLDIQKISEEMYLVHDIKKRHPLVQLIAMVPYGDIAAVEKLMQSGADDYISQPISIERLKVTLRNLLRTRDLLVSKGGEHLHVQRYVNGHASHHQMPVDFYHDSGQIKTLREIEDMVIERVVHSCNGCITRAAKMLGIGRSTLYRKMYDQPDPVAVKEG